MAFRKRVHAPRRFARNVRRKTMSRRRRGGRRGKTNQYSVMGALRAPLQLRGRKMRPRAWRSGLFRSTQYKTHYQARFFSQVGSAVTGSTANVGPLLIAPAMRTAAGSPFYLSANGTQPHDTGGSVPTFDGDIILRGGVIGLNIATGSSINQPIQVRVWLVRAAKNAIVSVLPATLSIAGTPTDVTDFAEFGKIIMSREGILNYENTAMKIQYRVGPQKIDQNQFTTQGGQQLYWLITAANLQDTTNITFYPTVTWSLSFSADAQ